jgi:flagellar transcriptional activator FlhD
MRRHIGDDGESNSAVAYLRLAKRMLRAGRAAGMRRLRISSELADMLEAFSLAQLRKLAASNFALCSFRVAELPIAAFDGGYEPAFAMQRRGEAGAPSRARPQAGFEDSHHVWAGRLLRAFAAAGLIVQGAALMMTLAPSLAVPSQEIATIGGASMALLAMGIVLCWWRKGMRRSPAWTRP